MFCGKLRQEHQLALARLAQSEQENSQLRQALSLAERKRDGMRRALSWICLLGVCRT